MKKLLLSILLGLPFMVNAQVQSPGTAETTPNILAKTGWTATANSQFTSEGPAGNIVDGDNATYWVWNYGNAADAVPYVLTIDMGSSNLINGIYIRPRNTGTEVPNNVTIEASTNGTDWTPAGSGIFIQSVSNQFLNFPSPVTCRYYRININTTYGSVGSSFAETGAFTNTIPDNTAYSRVGWTATGTSTQGTTGGGDNGGYAATLDKDITTYWHSRYTATDDVASGRAGTFGTLPITVEYDMQVGLKINKLSIVNRAGNTAGAMTQFKVSYKLNAGDAYITLAPVYASTLANPAVNNINLGQAITARYLKIDATAVASGTNAMMAEFRAHYDSTLPVSLTSFAAKANGSQVNLIWKTASEQNSQYFQVLRSADGQSFSPIGGKITAAGNSNSEKTYQATDYSPLKGNNYYKLNQYDVDGTLNAQTLVAQAKIATSGIEIASVTSIAGGVAINIYSPKALTGTVSTTNVTGQKLGATSVKLNEGYTKVTVPANATGLVIATLTTVEGTVSKKVIK